MELTKKEKRELFLGLFVLPVVPSILLWQKVDINYLMILFFVFWGLLLICFFSKRFASFIFVNIKKLLKKLGEIFSIIALVFVYIVAIIPTGLIIKLVKRDRLLLKNHNNSSYWKKFEHHSENYESQF